VKRPFLVVLLVAVAGTAGVVYWRYAATAAQDSGMPELLQYAPAGAHALVYVDLAALRDSAFASDLTALAPAQTPDREYLEFVQATGFDYARDLDRVLLVVRQQAPAQVELAIAEGRFDRGKIAAYALRTGKMERVNGAEIYEVPQSSAAGKNAALTFLAANRIALAQGARAREALGTVAQAGREGTLEPATRARVLRVSGSPVFAVARIDPVAENFAPGGLRSDQLNNLARNVRWVTLGLRPEGEVVHAAAEGECDTAENARQLAGTFDGLRMLGQSLLTDPATRARLTPQAAQVLEGLLGELRVTQDSQRVRLLLEFSREQLRELLRGPSAPATHH
jgi:hypothetical protein